MGSVGHIAHCLARPLVNAMMAAKKTGVAVELLREGLPLQEEMAPSATVEWGVCVEFTSRLVRLCPDLGTVAREFLALPDFLGMTRLLESSDPIISALMFLKLSTRIFPHVRTSSERLGATRARVVTEIPRPYAESEAFFVWTGALMRRLLSDLSPEATVRIVHDGRQSVRDVELGKAAPLGEVNEAQVKMLVTLDAQGRENADLLRTLGSVQSLILPGAVTWSDGPFELAAYYRPAAQTGGDWWWHDRREDGSMRLLLADVAGHGPAATLITAIVAGTYSLLPRSTEMPGALEAIHAALHRLPNDYCLTISAIEVNARRGTLSWWSAAAPPLFVLRQDGAVSCLVPEISSPIDRAPLRLSHHAVRWEKNDRLFVFTDGLVEAGTRSGHQVGLNRLRKALIDTRGLRDCAAARDQLAKTFEDWTSSQDREDDVTFALLDSRDG